MPENSGSDAASGAFKLPEWKGKLGRTFKLLVERINTISPVKGIGIVLRETPNGTQISQETVPSTPEDANGSRTGGGGTSGTPVDVVGALNAAAATYHFLQSAPPTPIP